MKNQNKLKINMIANAINGSMNVIFSLLSFRYVSSVLGVENIGRFNFSNTYIGYFIALAQLGIAGYAIREGSAIRKDENKLKILCNEIFSINIVSVTISYLLLFISLLLFKKIYNYKDLIFIFSILILTTALSVDWIYSIYENYLIIAIRSILFKVAAFILLLIFVKTNNDTSKYAIISVFSLVGGYLINYFFAKRNIGFHFVFNMNIKKHIIPLLIIFAMNASAAILINSDTTILGLLVGDRHVGIYSVAVKIYTILKGIFSAMMVVAIPQLAESYKNNDQNEFDRVSSETINTVITLIIPAAIGIACLSGEIVNLVAGTGYEDSSLSICILSFSLLLWCVACFCQQCILLPVKKEKIVFIATLIAAIINIVLDLIFIPLWKENAAALTTLISEGIAGIICWCYAKKYTKFNSLIPTICKSLIGALCIFILIKIIRMIITNWIILLIVSIIMSALLYVAIEIILKNKAIISVLDSTKRKFGINQKNI